MTSFWVKDGCNSKGEPRLSFCLGSPFELSFDCVLVTVVQHLTAGASKGQEAVVLSPYVRRTRFQLCRDYHSFEIGNRTSTRLHGHHHQRSYFIHANVIVSWLVSIIDIGPLISCGIFFSSSYMFPVKSNQVNQML
jgi:hypothetical protein